MINKISSAIAGIVVAVGAGTLVYYQKDQNTAYDVQILSTPFATIIPNTIDGRNLTEPSSTPRSTPVISSSVVKYTMLQVAQHNSKSSCWAVVNGNVYDLTGWISVHPGGEENILKLCGMDGSVGFNRQHGGKAKPENVLAGFKIGVLIGQ
jgi:cytochrome b involved in lipid metabolism